MQGYKGFRQIYQEASRRLKALANEQTMEPTETSATVPVHQLFSEVKELPREEIEVRPETFQGRDTKYAEETVEKITREGFDKSREPIVVWKAPDGKYVVISGHSRWEASKRLFQSGDKNLATMPVKVFLGDLDDATDYALLESNREVTQEGLISDLKAYKRARQRGYNREHLKGIFKPESRLRLLEDISYLNEQGSFINFLGTEAEKSLPYLQRNAQWAGSIRRDVPALTNAHEEELFRYLYGLGEDSRDAGKKKITISKDRFFELVNAKVSRIDFDPEQALNLDEHVSTSALTDPAKMEIQNIRAEIDSLVRERTKKDELIARATGEGQTDLVERFKQRQTDINQHITRKLLEIQKLEDQIGMIERSALDLFSQAEDTNTSPEVNTDDQPDVEPLLENVTHYSSKHTAMSKKPMKASAGNEPPQDQDQELAKEEFQIQHMLPDSPGDDPSYAWEITLRDYAAMKAEQRGEWNTAIKEADRKAHKEIVRQALAFDFEVPDEVLADYPGLGTPKKPEDEQYDPDTFIFEDNWFKAHPEKILGSVEHTTNKFNRPVTVVKGTLEEALQAINVPAMPTETQEDQPLETVVKEPLENLLSDPGRKANLETVIAETLQEQAEKTVNRLKGKKDKYADGCPEEYYCFDDIMASYNKGISADEIKAWIWYKRKSSGFNDEVAILKQSSGWSKYVVPLDQADTFLEKWLKEGILCYYKDNYMPSVLYYAENIHERLKELERDKKDIIRLFGQQQYERQLKGLNDIVPPALTLTDPKTSRRLFIKPDSAFAENTYIEGLADGTEVIRLPTEERIGLIMAFIEWLNARPKDEFKRTTNLEIITLYLKHENPRGVDDEEKLRMRQNAKKEGDAFFVRFLAEALLPQDREAIERRWNRIYNGYVEINYMKIPVGFTCSSTFKNKPLFIRKAQREGIGFISAHGSGCIAYDVGVGKTMTAILSLAQALEMGQCKRPFIVVPNATYTNWMAELRGKTENGKVVLSGLLPQYAVNDLYNLSEDHLKMVLGDQGQVQTLPENTITLLTYEGFNRLCFNDTTLKELGEELFEILNQGIEQGRDREQMKENIKGWMGKGSRGGVVSIEDLGLDYMIVDEAHAMKKSFTSVKGEIRDNEREKSTYDLHSGEPSMIAIRGFMVSQYILRKNNMRNVQLLTATPFTNSPLEIYSILSLIAYQQLTQWGIRNLKDFFDTFMRTSIELTINAKLKPERKEVVLGFNNLIALQQLIFKFITYKSGEDALIQRPNKVVLPLLNHTVDGALVSLPTERQVSTNLPMTTEQKAIMSRIELFIMGFGGMQDLCNSAGFEEEPQSGKGVELREAKMSKQEKEKARVLRGLSYARQVALSPYLFACNAHKTPTYRQYIETSPTLSYVMGCIRSVKEYHEQHHEPVSGQVIYMNAGIQYFPLIKEYLVKVIGYADSEIGIVSSGISAAKKEGIKERYLAGSIQIIIGSASIREGINLQNRSTVLYNCWLDWNPTDVKQLEGRIWRYGNMFANVRIVIPLLEDSISMFIFQKLEEKTSRINEIWYRAGRENALDLEDINPGELKLGLVTNPRMLAELMLVREKEEIEDEIIRLSNQRRMIESIHESRVEFKKHMPYIRKRADTYKPPREGASERAPSTLLKIFRDYLADEDQTPPWKDRDVYQKFSSAYYWMQRGLQETLEPRGLDLDFDEKTVTNKIKKEIEVLKKKKEEEVGSAAIAKKEAEIIRERKRKGYQRKTVNERVEEFAKMNPAMLSELMVYDDSPEAQEKQREQNQFGTELEASADELDEQQSLVDDLEEMEKILAELEELSKAA